MCPPPLDIDLASLELDTDLEAAAAGLHRTGRLDHRHVPAFALPGNRFLKKAATRADRRGIKEFIRPANARELLAHLPATADDRTHAVLRGDFVLCDIIPMLVAERGHCAHLRIATLGLSAANADTLACLVERGTVWKLTLLVSLYFAQVDKATVFRAVTTRLDGLARLVVSRNHAKIICLPTTAGDSFVVEGSANLRSSDNIEQIVVTNDPETHAFHAAWIDQIAA